MKKTVRGIMAASAALLLSVGAAACGSSGGAGGGQSVAEACNILEEQGSALVEDSLNQIDVQAVLSGDLSIESAVRDALAPATEGITNKEVLDGWNDFIDAIISDTQVAIEGGTSTSAVDEAAAKMEKLCPNF